MASLCKRSIFVNMLSILAIQLPLSIGIGVNYGRVANNLPPPTDVVGLYYKCGIQLMRLFEPNPDVLEALKGSSLQVSLGVKNEDVPNIASSPEAATQWVDTNIVPYRNNVIFPWVTVGNEMIPGSNAQYIPQAMQNIYNALQTTGLTGIKVTTVFYMAGIETSSPPSAGVFASDIVDVMKNVSTFLVKTRAPLMANVYPYFAYISNPQQISINFATFQPTDPVVDGDLKYSNLFDAMVDSIYAALEKIEARNVSLIIGETGWPTAGNEPYTSKENAEAYNKNLIAHVQSGQGTPRRPGQSLDVFIFAMFNENQKTPPGVENNWGLFYPDKSAVYPLLPC